jgi:hypothetical protein
MMSRSDEARRLLVGFDALGHYVELQDIGPDEIWRNGI